MDGKRVLLTNHCLVRPEQPYSKLLGLEIGHFVNPQYAYSPFGEVIVPPSSLLFTEIATDKLLSELDRESAAIELNRSCQYDVDIEIQPGDRVLFNIMMLIDNEDDKVGQFLLVPYDELYAAIRKDEIIMLNGHILVEQLHYDMKEEIVGGMPMYSIGRVREGVGRVVHVGNPVRRYAYGYNQTDLADPKKGDIVFFDHRKTVRVEWEGFNTLNPTGNNLLRLQRKDIFAIDDSVL